MFVGQRAIRVYVFGVPFAFCWLVALLKQCVEQPRVVVFSVCVFAPYYLVTFRRRVRVAFASLRLQGRTFAPLGVLLSGNGSGC